MSFICPKCGNQDVRFLGIKNGTTYCRKCISFQTKEGDTKEKRINLEVVLDLKYPLTQEQKRISDLLIEKANSTSDILIHAVCGAGKTEIVANIIYSYLKDKKRVVFFIPRRDLVIEIGERLKLLFPNTTISFVYGGHTKDLSGSLVVATTHQAFRFKNTFNLAIIDEIDAFPYKDDDLLNHFVLQSTKGPIISLSATPSQKDKENNEVLTLFKRFHGKPMPLPQVIKASDFYLIKIIFKLLKQYQKEKKPCFIYVPTIEEGEKLLKLVLHKYKLATFVYSQMPNRNQTLNSIHQGHFTIVITTTILERGVTFEKLQVIVYKADHFIFDKSTLLQICGRVGRKASHSEGDIFFLANKNKKEFSECIDEVKSYNENL